MNKNLFLLIVALLAINIVSASIELGNLSHNLEDTYIPGTALRGWINFSMDEEPANTLISAFDNSVTIEDLLDANDVSCTFPNPYECTCLPSDCQPGYNTLDSGESTKTYGINPLQSEIFGIKIFQVFLVEMCCPSSCIVYRVFFEKSMGCEEYW